MISPYQIMPQYQCHWKSQTLHLVPHLWHFPSYLHNNTDFHTCMDTAWKEFSSVNSSHIDNPNLFWEAIKAYLRGKVISYAASFKKHVLASYREASSRLQLAQCSLSTPNSPANRTEWQTAKQAFDSWADTLELTKQAHMDAMLNKYGNKMGKLLVRLCSSPHLPTYITSLRDTLGTVKTTPQKVNKVMLQFYSSLYPSDPTEKNIAQKFLDELHLPMISPSQLETQNALITMLELSFTIRHLAPNKAPGPEGFTGEFYRTLRDTVVPTLYNTI